MNKDIILVVGLFLFLIMLFSFGIWWEVYKYKDCRKVNHSKLYCIMNIGK